MKQKRKEEKENLLSFLCLLSSFPEVLTVGTRRYEDDVERLVAIFLLLYTVLILLLNSMYIWLLFLKHEKKRVM